MKTIYLILSVLILCLFGCHSNQTILSYEILNLPDENNLRFTYETEDYSLPLDANGKGKLILNDISCGIGELASGYTTFPIFLKDGKNINIKVDLTPPQRTIEFTGDLVNENSFLNMGFKGIPDRGDHLSENEFILWWQNELNKKIKSLDSLGFDEDFKKIETERIKARQRGNLISYAMFGNSLPGNENYKPSPEFIAFMSVQIEEEPTLLNYHDYRRSLSSLIRFVSLANNEYSSFEESIITQLEWIGNNINNPLIGEYLVNNLLTSYMESRGVNYFDRLKSYYTKWIKTPDVKQTFDSIYDSYAAIAEGIQIPSFVFKTKDGEDITLDKFKGKYIYIDTWASWCRPCIAEIPPLKELEKELVGKDIEFVSISIDEDKDAWLKALDIHDLQGNTFHVGNSKEYTEFFRIKSIPRFILLDKELRIVTVYADRPSSTILKEHLLAL